MADNPLLRGVASWHTNGTGVATCNNAAATDLLLALGRAYHQAGIPTDTLEDILHAVAVSLAVELQVNTLPTSLTVAIGAGTNQRLVILRLERGRLHLRKLALLNVVYRRLLGREIDVDTTLPKSRQLTRACDRGRPSSRS